MDVRSVMGAGVKVHARPVRLTSLVSFPSQDLCPPVRTTR